MRSRWLCLIIVVVPSLALLGCGRAEPRPSSAAGGAYVSPVASSEASVSAPPPAQPIAKVSYAGTSWTVSAVRHAGQTISVPASWRARITFERDGRIRLFDTLNPLNGRYTETSDGFTTRNLNSGAAGSAGMATRQAVIRDAIDAIAGIPASTDAAGATRIQAEMLNRTLILKTSDYQVTLERRDPGAS